LVLRAGPPRTISQAAMEAGETVKQPTREFDFAEVLTKMSEERASDVHLSPGFCPAIRVRGRIVPLEEYDRLSPQQTRDTVYSLLNDEQRKRFESNKQLDLAYAVPGVARFRVNCFFQRGSISAAFRRIPHQIPKLDELGLPRVLEDLTHKPRGLVLVTGPTGSGKSTSLAAMLDIINEERDEHMLTIEDPIEFLHQHKRCIVNQREIGPDATGFADALRAALRQDPDVILVGEMRDRETIGTALTAAETGHLVFATLHTQSAPQTIDRIIDVFPAEQQAQVRTQLAGTLQGIITQALLPTADGQGRVAALEILLLDDAVRNVIRQAKIEQVYSYMQTGTKRGMQTMEQSLADLIMRNVVTYDEALNRSSRKEELVGVLERSGFDSGLTFSSPTFAAPEFSPALRVAGS
jgi:twitching motility protein PilT